MRLGNEKVLRKAHNEDMTMIVTEYESKGKVYCRTHYDFHDSYNVFIPFEELCVKLNITP